MNKTKLKQCPFCGNKEITVEQISFSVEGKEYVNTVVKCAFCGGQYRASAGEKNFAIAQWNKRELASDACGNCGKLEKLKQKLEDSTMAWVKINAQNNELESENRQLKQENSGLREKLDAFVFIANELRKARGEKKMKEPPYLKPWKITPGDPKLKHQKWVNIVGEKYKGIPNSDIVTVFNVKYAVNRKIAHLIATAPEMYKKLSDIAFCLKYNIENGVGCLLDDAEETLLEIEDLLKKARGEK